MGFISQTLSRWVSRNRDRDYISNLSEAAREDMGVTLDEAMALVDSRPDTRERMLKMAALFELSEADIDRDRQTCLEVSLACGRCKSSRVCASFLAGDRSVSPLDFCPNASTYADLAGAA